MKSDDVLTYVLGAVFLVLFIPALIIKGSEMYGAIKGFGMRDKKGGARRQMQFSCIGLVLFVLVVFFVGGHISNLL